MSMLNGFRLLLGGCLVSCSLAAQAQIFQPPGTVVVSEENAIVDAATLVLNEVMATPGQGIPAALLRDAQAVAIVPGMLKGGFVVGVRHGRGVVVVREETGAWRAPSFISITGGSVGWQIGIQSSDLILVFKTRKSVQGLLSGKFTIGADAAAAAGPVGREASAATDAALKAEIYSYSRSRGLFAGVSLDGSMISMDNAATAIYYAGGQVPAAAITLVQAIATYSGTQVAAEPAAFAQTALAVPNGAPADAQALRGRLAQSCQQLSPLLDPQWRTYLALPAEVYNGGTPPAGSLKTALDRYSTVNADPRYTTLSQRPEFQETLGLLRASVDADARAGGALSLPAPPK